jgi:hypothetical protein
VAFTGAHVAGDFRETMAKVGAEKAIACFIRAGRDYWAPLYKPSGIARLIAEHGPKVAP